MKEAVKIIISSLLIIAVLILIFGSLIRRWLLIPINRLSQISDKVSAGDLSSRVPLETSPLFRDELSNLSKTFNQMLQNLNQNFNEIKSKEHFLQSLIDNIPDGIRVIDENYNIVIANKTYYKQTQHPVPNSPEKCYFSSQRINHPCISTTHSCPLREIKKQTCRCSKPSSILDGKTAVTFPSTPPPCTLSSPVRNLKTILSKPFVT